MAYGYPGRTSPVILLPQRLADPRLVSYPFCGPSPGFGFGFGFGVGVPFNLIVLNSRWLPLPDSAVNRMEFEKSLSLIQFMENEGLVPSPEEELKRKNAIEELKKIVLWWVKKIAWQRGFPNDMVGAASATILTYGSYGLGVHGSESDIDALCVGPWFASSTEDFFVVLYNMLQSRPEVSDIHCVKDAKVPLMRFKFDGIPIDLPYARLMLPSVPESVDLLNPISLHGIDETSLKSLSGVRVNMRILKLVPNLQNFQSLLRCIKLWAKRRGLYGNLFGYLGGVHLAILAAFICQRDPFSSLSILVASFFYTFAQWPWPTPVILNDGNGRIPAMRNVNGTRAFLPIMLPFSPYDYCQSNITKSTFSRIKSEFARGQKITKCLRKPDFDWGLLFDPYAYNYSQYAKISLSTSDSDLLGDWIGWVKSRFPFLLQKLEEALGYCDPNPTEYVDYENPNPSVAFYWGLNVRPDDHCDISLVEADFRANIRRSDQSSGDMRLYIVKASELPNGSGKGTKACWRMPEYDSQQVPLYSKHLPSYFVGYLAPSTSS